MEQPEPSTIAQFIKKLPTKILIRNLITGFFMGAADIVPGVSGGTIAFISGIYEELIAAIKGGFYVTIPLFFRGKFVEAIKSVNWTLLVPLGIGIGSAILLLAGLLERALTNYPATTWAFFFGLVLASIATVLPKVKQHTYKTILAFILGTVSMFVLVGVVPVETPATWWAFILSGMLAICAMILPGISGSFILLILGKYRQILSAVNDGNFGVVLLVGLGCIIGLGVFSRVLDYIFKNYHDLTISLLAGVLLGSLRIVWPWRVTVKSYLNSNGDVVPLVQNNIAPYSTQSLIVALIVGGLGFGFVILFEYLQNRNPGKKVDNAE